MIQRFAAFDAVRDLKHKPFRSLCYAPDVHLSFAPNGDVSACCRSRAHVLGNVQTASLDDIWHGERVRELRELLHRYAFPAGCESCRWSLEAETYINHPIRDYDRFAVTADSRWPRQLEFALSNTCNFACIMCSSTLSSVVRAKEGLPPMPRVYGDRFFDELARYLPHVQSLSFLGGEPFLQRECHRIWDMLIDRGLRIPCHITTNGSVYNARVERVLHSLPVSLSVSLDGATKTTIERIRVNAKYDVLMQNVRRFNAYARERTRRFPGLPAPRLQLNFCVMRQNWHEAADFFLFAEDMNCRVLCIFVIGPADCSVFTLNRSERRRIADTVDAQTAGILDRLTVNRNVWLDMTAELRSHALAEARDVNHGFRDAAGRVPALARGSAGRLLRAWQLRTEERFAEALRELEPIGEGDAQWYRAKCVGGEIRIAMGDHDGAQRELDEAIALARKRPEAHLIRAWHALVLDRMEEAVAACRTASDVAVPLADVEAAFIETNLVERLKRHEALANVLPMRWPRRET